jgi:hypothetical protein
MTLPTFCPFVTFYRKKGLTAFLMSYDSFTSVTLAHSFCTPTTP